MLLQDLADIPAIAVPDETPLIEQLKRNGPINLDWAREVMEARGMDGLVLADPVNVFHVTGHLPFAGRTRPGAPPTMFVVLSRNPDRPPALVIAQFYYYYTMVDGNFHADRPVYLFGGGRDFADLGETPLDTVESTRKTRLDAGAAQRPAADGQIKTLAAALRDQGLASGHVGYDYEPVLGWMDSEGLSVRWEPADDVIRHIRLVKSPLEIALMRHASAVNLAAVHATFATARDGLSHRDFRRTFFTEAAARGSQGVILTVDRSSNEMADYRLANGQSVMIDAVSKYQGYHGDYGRTLLMGEPRAPLRRAIEAMSAGWESVREALRPGMLYSEVTALGQEAVRKSGYDFPIAFTPHSVGLAHTDEPIDWSSGLPGKADLRLRENMIISVDCPVLATGYGGSSHLEDLSLITKDGCEPIHPVSPAAIIV